MKTFTGEVISIKTPKTVIVRVTRIGVHPLYKKQMKLMKKFKAHYENESPSIGDKVKIIETRPLSKDKHFKVLESKKK